MKNEGANINPESIDNHDAYINHAFIEMMDHADNADIVRQANMLLSMSDPARDALASVVADVAPGSTMTLPGKNAEPKARDHDVVNGIDKDGDQMRVSYVQGVTQDEYDTDAALIFAVTPGRFLMPIERVPAFVRWLESRVAKHERGVA